MRGLYLLAVVLGAGCTSIDVAKVPDDRQARGGMFVTSQDLYAPYESLGPIQATRRGVTFVGGLVDPAGLDLQAGFDELLPVARAAGADGIINVRYTQTQHTVPVRLLFTILFFVPLNGEVTVTGELVKLK